MPLDLNSLRQSIAALPPSEDRAAALDLLRRPDLTRVAFSGEPAKYSPADSWLRIFRIRHMTTRSADIATFGFPSLLRALEALPPSRPLTISAFQADDWLASFWSDEADQLVGFVLVQRRSAEEEQARLDWFTRHMT